MGVLISGKSFSANPQIAACSEKPIVSGGFEVVEDENGRRYKSKTAAAPI